jgi:hypothetical protein
MSGWLAPQADGLDLTRSSITHPAVAAAPKPTATPASPVINTGDQAKPDQSGGGDGPRRGGQRDKNDDKDDRKPKHGKPKPGNRH